MSCIHDKSLHLFVVQLLQSCIYRMIHIVIFMKFEYSSDDRILRSSLLPGLSFPQNLQIWQIKWPNLLQDISLMTIILCGSRVKSLNAYYDEENRPLNADLLKFCCHLAGQCGPILWYVLPRFLRSQSFHLVRLSMNNHSNQVNCL